MMKRKMVTNLKRYRQFFTVNLSILLIITIAGCGEADYSSTDYSSGDTGGIAFSVVWEGAPTKQDNQTVSRALDCSAADVDTVTFEVFDGDQLLTDNSFECIAGSGTVNGVPVGTNRKLAVSGKDSNGTVVYYGEEPGITVTAGKDTPVGEIVCSQVDCTDYDSDDYYAEAECGVLVDCDDFDSSIYPGATEVCGDGIDQDCDGSDAVCQLIWYRDADGDTYGDPYDSIQASTQPSGYVADNTDCDDTSGSVNPNGTEIECDGIDQDCSGADLCTTSYGIVAYYPFNGNANDESGNGNDGTVYGALLTTDRLGKSNSAYSFDGTDDKITIPNGDSLNISNLTVSVWLRTTDSEGTIFESRSVDRISYGWKFFITLNNGAGLNFHNGDSVTIGSPINDNQWHHIIATFDGLNTAKIYLDGSLANTNDGIGNVNLSHSNDRYISANESGSGMSGIAAIDGTLDDICIYDRVLSETEIKLLYEAEYTNSLNMTFNLIPAGTFTMGSPTDELGRDPGEIEHQVTLTQPFYMQTTEVTQNQWEMVMGSNPSYFSSCGNDCPVEQVSWNDTQAFLVILNSLGEGTYSLPTEAQWEYAARSGSTTAIANGDITETFCNYDENLDALGWYCHNAGNTTHLVAQKDANAYGLYDMHGNVLEWCQDWYTAYSTDSVTDPTGPTNGTYRMQRGGSFSAYTSYCRSSKRSTNTLDYNARSFGLRIVRKP